MYEQLQASPVEFDAFKFYVKNNKLSLDAAFNNICDELQINQALAPYGDEYFKAPAMKIDRSDAYEGMLSRRAQIKTLMLSNPIDAAGAAEINRLILEIYGLIAFYRDAVRGEEDKPHIYQEELDCEFGFLGVNIIKHVPEKIYEEHLYKYNSLLEFSKILNLDFLIVAFHENPSLALKSLLSESLMKCFKELDVVFSNPESYDAYKLRENFFQAYADSVFINVALSTLND